MFGPSTPPSGFAAATRDERASRSPTLPVLIATASLFLSTAVLLTVMTMSARAAQLY